MEWGEDSGQEYAAAALASYGLEPETPLRLLSLSENATFLVGENPPLGVLRVYRPEYQTDVAKRSELAWITLLRIKQIVSTPAVFPTLNGDDIVRVEIDGDARDCVLFEYIDANELATSGQANTDMSVYKHVGSLVATLHRQVLEWQEPEWFERMRWNVETVLGIDAPWGDWRNAPGLSADDVTIIEQAESRLRERLASYPQTPENSGLVHGDLRTTNIMKDKRGQLWVIDFDDAGYSWLLWDLCSTTSFIEHTEELDDIVKAWLEGYTSLRPLGNHDLNVIPDLVFLRRLHLLGWVGSHQGADAAQEIGQSHVRGTVELARKYLAGQFLARIPAS